MIKHNDYFAISRAIEQKHVLFYALWNLGKPVFTEEIETAAVRFNTEGEHIDFVFNPKFWEKLTEYERLFIICHECLHVILEHGRRILDAQNKEACNIALDVVVNHLLVDKFDFDRQQISMASQLCWLDSVFKNQHVSKNKNFEYYFNLLNKESSSIKGSGSAFDFNKKKKLQTIDDHTILEESQKSVTSQEIEKIIEKAIDQISNEEKESIKNAVSQLAGTHAGGLIYQADTAKVKHKKKWETVIKKWSRKYDRTQFYDQEQWARVNRRFTFLDSDIILPSEMEEEREEEGKIDVFFFQDTSGSCEAFKDRFFSAAKSLPLKRFNIRLFCFDTQVYETSLSSGKLYGFGGTYFHILEEFVQQTMKKEGIAYPKACFVITDGYGSKIEPQIPMNWYWFLSTKEKSCIHEKCNVFQLSDYE